MPKRKNGELTEGEKRYCMERVRGKSLAKAYEAAGYAVTHSKYAAIRGAKIENRPHVQKYMEELKESVWVQNAMSIAEKRSLLADVARAKPADITEESPIASLSVDGEGNRSLQGPKVGDKLKAIELDSRLSGELSGDDSKNQVLIQLVNDRLEIPSLDAKEVNHIEE
jgi:phage terminase small subunit